jgi:hypothetical protein
MWRIIVNTSGIGQRERYERISSSGYVFSGKPAVKSNSKNSQVNGILFRLIEEEIELTFRSQNCLNNAGIKLIGQLVQKSASELLSLKNFGRRSLHEIEKILTEMGLTLEMTLDFPPWNGDGNGDELIQILSMQCNGVGFQMNHKIAKILGIDIDKLKIEASKMGKNVTVDKFLLLSTALILQYLRERFEMESPYLFDVAQKNQKWLQKELKQDVTDILSEQFKTRQGGNKK